MQYILKNFLFIFLISNLIINIIVLEQNVFRKLEQKSVQYQGWQDVGKLLLELEQYHSLS